MHNFIISKTAAGLGIEPRLKDPKSSVLPLNDPAMFYANLLFRYALPKPVFSCFSLTMAAFLFKQAS